MQVPMNMQKILTISIATLAMALAISPVALAQSAAPSAPKNQPAFDPRDLSGQWSGGLGGGVLPPPPPPAFAGRVGADGVIVRAPASVTPAYEYGSSLCP